MSNHRHPNVSEVAADQPPPARRRRARWLVAGVAGVAGLAAVSAPTGVTGALGASGSSLVNAGEQVLAGSTSRLTGDDNKGQDRGGTDHKDDDHRGGEGDHVTDVPCGANELIAALVRANAGNGATLKLAGKCTYTLNASAPQPPVPHGPIGLPIITQRVAIDGNGATIVRAANAAPFRILEVGAGGDLQLRDVTIKGGQDTSGIGGGGGGIRIDIGGRATIENTDVVFNRTNGSGGGIANYGDTRILGRSDHGEGKDRDGKDRDGKDRDGKDRDKHGDDESKISDNAALYDGGGVYNNGNLTVRNTRISDNNTIGVVTVLPIGGTGGGLSNSSVAVLDNVRVHHNTSGFRGGGIRSGINATTTARNIEVSENATGSEGGGIFSDGIFHLEHSKISRNSAGQRGGGIFNQIGRFVVEDSQISENAASTFSTIEHGGGVYVGSGIVVLRHTHINRNKAVGTNSRGGGIYNRGTVNLTESTVTENVSALTPGGVFNEGGQVTVDEKSVISANRPTNCTPSAPPVPNCFG
ncbi:right-handed parallel beta-helix repeat-containing protein [Micromonospora sp. NPDC049204]|uniref:right-handed parallel beta-helix repeat-containing protein n=1 Tax=Micromonospora sp. NPDC049204 TaxID=3154351 RepID=UPI0033FF5370